MALAEPGRGADASRLAVVILVPGRRPSFPSPQQEGVVHGTPSDIEEEVDGGRRRGRANRYP